MGGLVGLKMRKTLVVMIALCTPFPQPKGDFQPKKTYLVELLHPKPKVPLSHSNSSPKPFRNSLWLSGCVCGGLVDTAEHLKENNEHQDENEKAKVSVLEPSHS